MIAASYERNHTIRIGECEPVTPGPDDVQIRVAFGGICGTDLHIYHGKMDWRTGESRVIGHEISGTVAAIGANVHNLKVGDPVTVMPLLPCGNCPACAAGHSHICHNLKFLGIDASGGFQSLWTVPAYTILPLPKSLSLQHAALIEPIAVACHDIRLGRVKAGEFVVVLGGGPIGALIAFVARQAGARVLVSEINPHRLAALKKLGIDAVNPTTVDLPAHVDALTGGAGADAVFEVTGHKSGIEMATKLPRTRGRIIAVGIFSEPPPVDLFRFFWRELQLIGARVYEREDFAKAIELAASGALPLESLISDVVPLSGLRGALDRMGGSGDVMKILVNCAAEAM